MNNSFNYAVIGRWISLQTHFTASEMHCRCGCGMQVTPKLITRIEALRSLVGKPLNISSGARCQIHNKAIGGYPKSKHLRGIAVDIIVDGNEALTNSIVHHAQNLGFNGIGVDNSFVHIDLRIKPARWTY